MKIIDTIKEIRLKKSINKQTIADALDVDVAVVSNIETGKRELKVSELEKISNVLEVDIETLLSYHKGINSKVSVSTEDAIWAPLVSQYAHAGYLSGFGDEEYIKKLPMVPWMVDKEYHGNYIYVLK